MSREPVSRSRGREHPCEVPAPPHSVTYSRFYPCGWRCDRHSPAAMAAMAARAASLQTRQDDHR